MLVFIHDSPGSRTEGQSQQEKDEECEDAARKGGRNRILSVETGDNGNTKGQEAQTGTNKPRNHSRNFPVAETNSTHVRGAMK